MQFILVLFVSLFLILPAAMPQAGAGTIRGRVEAAGSPVHDATVVLLPSRKSVRTSQDGSFEITAVAPGKHELIAHQHAFTDQKRTVTVTAGGSVEVIFSLGFAPVHQEITITASGREETTLETFSTVTSLDGHQLATRNSAAALGELLDHQVGIAKRSYGPGSSRPVIRGFDGDRVLVLQDGSRTGTLSSQSGDHGEPVEGSELERVEVVRGPATLLYGSNAIGGVVNVITRHHELDQHAHEGVRGHLSALGGTNNGLGGGSAGFEIGKGNFLLWGSGGGQRTGNYKTPIGEILNSGSRMTQTAVGMGRYTDRTFFTLSYGFQDGRYGVPFPPEGADDHDDDHHHDNGDDHDHEGEEDDHDHEGEENGHDHEGEEHGEEHAHFHENVKIDWRKHNFRFTGGFRQLEGFLETFRATVNMSDWKHSELEGAEVGTRFSNRQWTGDALFQQKQRGPLSGSFGVWALRRDFSTVGAEALAPPVDQNAVALYSVQQLSFERIRFQFGGRFERNAYTAQGLTSRGFNGLSGAAGVFVPAWNGGAVVFNYTSSYRAPALEELYNRGPHLGNLVYEIGNPNLRRERGHGMELSLRHTSNRVRAEISGFYNRMNDFVYLAPTGEFEDGLVAADYAQADARYLGADARLDVALARDLWLNLGFDAVDAQLRRSSIPLPRMPPVRGKVGLDMRRGGFNFRPELLIANRQWQTFSTETETAGYAVANLIGTYTLARQHTSHLFGVNFFNVGDRLYRNHLSFIKEFAPEIGRGIRFSYTLNFF